MKLTQKEESILARLDEGLAKAKANGLQIINFGFGDGVKSCCAVSTIIADPTCEPVNQVAEALAISYNEVWEIIDGFDSSVHETGLQTIGQILRDKYINQIP